MAPKGCFFLSALKSADYRSVSAFELLFSALAKFISILDYMWCTDSLEIFFAITLHNGSGGLNSSSMLFSPSVKFKSMLLSIQYMVYR